LKKRLIDIIPSITLSLLLLIFFEILNSTLIPAIGFGSFRFQFHMLLVLYLGFKLNSPVTSILVLLIEYFHSFFSVEGWAVGTFCGVIIVITITYLRDVINLKSGILKILITQLFQLLWFALAGGLIYIRMDDMTYVIAKFWRFVPESIVISLTAPFMFMLLDRIWHFIKEDGIIGESR